MAHITEETFAFLFDLDVHNSKAWMDANRERYETHVKQALYDFCEDLRGPLHERVSPRLESIGRIQGGSVFQIHRDTRFSDDKTPYKRNAGAWFGHDQQQASEFSLPGLYLHLEPGASFMGAGIYRPPNPTLGAVRDKIVDTPGAWTRARRAVQDAGFTFGGDRLRTSPRGYDADHDHIDDLRRTSYIVSRDLAEDEVTAEDFVERFCDHGRDALPLLRFVARALSVPF